jgi:hypothetical protein
MIGLYSEVLQTLVKILSKETKKKLPEVNKEK